MLLLHFAKNDANDVRAQRRMIHRETRYKARQKDSACATARDRPPVSFLLLDRDEILWLQCKDKH